MTISAYSTSAHVRAFRTLAPQSSRWHSASNYTLQRWGDKVAFLVEESTEHNTWFDLMHFALSAANFTQQMER